MFELGREVVKTVGGKAYRFARLERSIVEEFRDWIATQEGDPFTNVKELIGVLDPAAARTWVAEAKEVKDQLRSFSLGCPLAQRYLKTEIGQGELCYLLLRKHQPEITRDEAFAVWTAIGAEEYGSVLAKTQGSPPKNAEPPAA